MSESATALDIVIFDLDRTLLDTPRYMDDVSELLSRSYGIDAKDFSEQVPANYVEDESGAIYYDLFRHVATLNLDPCELEAFIREGFEGRDYSRDGAADLVAFVAEVVRPEKMQVLTHGEEKAQRLKSLFVPSIAGIEFVPTLEQKGDYIRREFQDSKGVIIDDKQIAGLPGGFGQIWTPSGQTTSGTLHGYESLVHVQENWDEAVRKGLELAA